MCIIALQPAGIPIPKVYIDTMWENNPDMSGYAYVDENDEVIIKKFSFLEAFKSSYRKDYRKYGKETPFLLHFRIKTHGPVNEDNCHPFQVFPGLVFAHNGIIDIRIPKKYKDMSDTRYFNKSILQQLPRNFLKNGAIIELIEEYIGHGSKLAFLDKHREYHILNEYFGHWHNGVWYSNKTYEELSYFTGYGGWDTYPSRYTTTTTYKPASKSAEILVAKQLPMKTGKEHLEVPFASMLCDKEAQSAGYDDAKEGSYCQQKWAQWYYNKSQIILRRRSHDQLLDFVKTTGYEYANVYLDDEMLASALSIDPADLAYLKQQKLPLEQMTPDEIEEAADRAFYKSITKEQEQLIQSFADSAGATFDEIFDDIDIVKQILGDGFSDMKINKDLKGATA